MLLTGMHTWTAAKRYFFADFAQATKDWKAQVWVLETLLAASHNAGVRKRIQWGNNDVLTAKAKALEEIEEARTQDLQRIEQRREDALERQRRLFLLAAVAFANSFANPPRSGNAVVFDKSATCSGDYDCGAVGAACIKDNFQSTGFCAKTVNEYGVQTFHLARPDSVLPKMPSPLDCRWDPDCPIGFQCASQSGACVRRVP